MARKTPLVERLRRRLNAPEVRKHWSLVGLQTGYGYNYIYRVATGRTEAPSHERLMRLAEHFEIEL